MPNERVHEISGPGGAASARQAAKAEKAEAIAERMAFQVESAEDLQATMDDMVFNPRAIQQKFDPLKHRARPVQTETAKSHDGGETRGEAVDTTTAVEELAEDYHERNPELQKQVLTNLFQEMQPGDSHATILKRLQKTYTDAALADEAIDFLIEVSENKEEIREKFIKVKKDFQAQYGREIQGGRNIGAQARAFSEKGLGSPTALRTLYREVTGNPRSPYELFEELTEKFKFSDMKNIIDFILHSLGADMKAKGPSISRAELQRLFGEARTMQAILGVFRFFYGRMKLIQKQFALYELEVPGRVNFEALSRLLMKLLQERYPASDKVLKCSVPIGIAEQVAAQLIVYTQFRDAMRHISPKLFRSDKHRQELLMAIIEALSDLEDMLDQQGEEE